MNLKSLFIVWYSHSRRAETLAAELGGQVSFQYETRLKRRWLLPLRYLVQSWKTWRLLEQEQPDVVLVQEPPIIASLVVAAWCELRGRKRASGHRIPYGIDSHSDIFYSREWHWALPLLRLLARRAAVTTVASEAALELVKSWGVKGIFLVDGLPNLSPATGTVGCQGEERVAVISSFDPDEPIAEIFAAARLLPIVTFYFSGNPKRAQAGLLVRKPENVVLTGFLSESDYTGLLKNVHGLVILTKEPNILNCGTYEAIAVEKPAVISNWPQMRRCFTRGFIYVDNTPEAIAQGIRQVLDKQSSLKPEIVAMRSELMARRRPAFEKLTALLKGEDEPARATNTKTGMRDTQRTLLAISVQPPSTLEADIDIGKQPGRDYYALQQALNADVLYLNDAQMTFLGRLIARVLGKRIALAWAAFRKRRMYDVLYSDSEIVGLPLALLLKLSRTPPGQPRHVMHAHYLSPFKKRIFFWLGVARYIDTIIVWCAAQHALATKVLHIPEARVIRLPYFADTDFWRPFTPSEADRDVAISGEAGSRPMICASGLEFRDYPTLLKAVRNLDVDVRIAAGSAFAGHRASFKLTDLPTHVLVRSYNYEEMRALYNAAQFVVVPLLESDWSAGITVILEAMAMGKAVIVSRTRGQIDVIRDPRDNYCMQQWWPGFLDAPDVAETLGSLPTGLYVTPGDPDELRDAIQYLLDHPEIAEALGRNGRHVVEAYFGLHAFAQRYAATIRGEALPLETRTSIAEEH